LIITPILFIFYIYHYICHNKKLRCISVTVEFWWAAANSCCHF